MSPLSSEQNRRPLYVTLFQYWTELYYSLLIFQYDLYLKTSPYTNGELIMENRATIQKYDQ